mgnify:CR=1 FL=1
MSYLEIQQYRYRDILEFEIHIPEELGGIPVPKLSIQPLAENAIYHGIKNRRGKGKILIEGREEGDALVLTVSDNGQGMTKEQIEKVLSKKIHNSSSEGDSTGIGMNNVISRLELYYEQDGLMEIYSEGEGMGTEVVINIPVERSENNVQNPAC